jgi:hypothetical protein
MDCGNPLPVPAAEATMAGSGGIMGFAPSIPTDEISEGSFESQ